MASIDFGKYLSTPLTGNPEVQRELEKLEQVLALPMFPGAVLEALHAAPNKLIDGMIVRADGTDWNPGYGSGIYWYDADAAQWWLLASTTVAGTMTLGGLRLSDTSWDDLKFPATGNRLDSASTRYSFDYTNLGIQFDADARHTEEQLSYVVQMPHAWKEGTAIYPHIHWIQTTANEPNWLMAYRVYNNNEAPGSFTLAPWDSQAFTYTSGTICQITSFPSITMTGKTLSCIIDVKLWRDVANGSTEFTGAESTPIAVLLKEFDIHYEVDSFGSNTEFTKGT